MKHTLTVALALTFGLALYGCTAETSAHDHGTEEVDGHAHEGDGHDHDEAGAHENDGDGHDHDENGDHK